jgi:putative flippase GtrA
MISRPKPALALQFISFAGVGSIGFAVDALIFLSLTAWHASWHPYAGRAVSALCAVSATWALNRRVTFSDRKSADVYREYVRYVLAQLLGLALNLGVFAAGVALVPALHRRPILALLLGAGVALAVNFLTAKNIAFRRNE